MADDQGDKTEQPTAKRLAEALGKGQFAKSQEIQTAFVLMAGVWALQSHGGQLLNDITGVFKSVFFHLHDTPIDVNGLQDKASESAMTVMGCVGPPVLATGVAGIAAGLVQSRFRMIKEPLSFNWDRLSPMAGFKRLFSTQALVPMATNFMKLGAVGAFSWGQVRAVLDDPIFNAPVDIARVGTFFSETAIKIGSRVLMALLVIAALDYAYQLWKTGRDLMMSKEEVKDESKQSEGNPHVKGEIRKRRMRRKSFKAQLDDLPNADVVIANPTHIAVALRYDRDTMAAPKIIAMAKDYNALRIRELAQNLQIPVMENKPLARMLFKYGKIDQDIPLQLYTAVAEILAYVYRVNRFRYYSRAQSQGAAAGPLAR
jgi:flagellar biosynthetic protein FlhB